MRFHEIICSAIFLSYIWESSAQKSCNTPNKSNGTCVSIKSCQYLLNIVAKNQSLTAADRHFLRQSQCGFDGQTPKVCCAPESLFPSTDLPQPGLCGNFLFKIVSTNPTIGDYPWVALLQGSDRSIQCGGVVIDQNYILTAAHCVTKNGTLSSVRLGEHNIASEIDCECETHECADPILEIPIDEIIVHENYDPNSISQLNDIALIRLIKPINFTDFVQPVCMPVGEQLRMKNLDTLPLIIAGFGQNNTKQAQFVDVLAEQRCYDANNATKQTTANQMCINQTSISDSGGPLIADYQPQNGTRHMVLVGVQSFGAGGESLIYTKAIEYMDWILYHMRK